MARKLGMIRPIPKNPPLDWDSATMMCKANSKAFQAKLARPEMEQLALSLQHCLTILLDMTAHADKQSEEHNLQDVAKVLQMPARRMQPYPQLWSCPSHHRHIPAHVLLYSCRRQRCGTGNADSLPVVRHGHVVNFLRMKPNFPPDRLRR